MFIFWAWLETATAGSFGFAQDDISVLGWVRERLIDPERSSALA
jgi:hypothetical protein